MALRWIEGFEVAANSYVMPRIYEDFSVTGSFGATTGRHGGLAVNSNNWYLRTKALVGAPTNTWTSGFEFNRNSTTLTTGPHVAFFNGAQEQIRCEIQNYVIPGGVQATNGFKLVVKVGGVTLATSNEFFPYYQGALGTAKFIEFKAVIADGVGGEFHAQVSDIYGTTETTTITWDAANTGVDTQALGITGADSCKLSGENNSNHKYDNWYVSDDATFLGPIVVQGYLPLADGDTSDWGLDGGASDVADAWAENANEGSVAEDDKRLSSSVVAEEHLCTLENGDFFNVNVIGGASNVLGVRADIHARMETAGDLDIGLRWRQGSTTVESGVLNVASTAMSVLSQVEATNPVTSSAWLASEPLSLQIGVINNG